MALLDLTAEEVAFFAQPWPREAGGPDHRALQRVADFAQRLGQGLARTLQARLRLPMALVPHPYEPVACAQPCWHVSPGLAGLWLMRRLGTGNRPTAGGRGTMAHVPPAMLRTLDAVLAERWLDAPARLPGGLAWRLGEEDSGRLLALDLPSSPADMTRWAQACIAA